MFLGPDLEERCRCDAPFDRMFRPCPTFIASVSAASSSPQKGRGHQEWIGTGLGGPAGTKSSVPFNVFRVLVDFGSAKLHVFSYGELTGDLQVGYGMWLGWDAPPFLFVAPALVCEGAEGRTLCGLSEDTSFARNELQWIWIFHPKADLAFSGSALGSFRETR